MSVQIFLQGKLLGIDQFLVSQAQTGRPAGQALVAGRAHWVTLLSEVLPRALLAELGLARILLGSSGGGKFFVVLPQEALPAAQAFLESACRALETMSAHNLRLVWASTENLGDWTIVRKRLAEEMWRREHTAPVPSGEDAFRPRARTPLAGEDDYFENYLAPAIHRADVLGWSPDTPGRVLVNEGKHTWSTSDGDGVHIARKTALDEAGVNPASTAELAARAAGKPAWGILRGEVDGFSIRLRRAQTIEEHLQLEVAFKQFFAGELEVACTMPDFWRKVSILSSGEDDFAVYGAWDALLQLARELQRLFHRFAEANLKELPGPEGKTITMALELAPEAETPFATVLEAARRNLDIAKAADKDCLHIFGRTVEWRHVNHANDLKEMMLRMVRRFHCPPAFLEELSGFYREKPAGRADRPWRYYRRLAVVLGDFKDRELQRLQKALITDIVGKSATQVKLRPAGRVAVEWARLLVGPMQLSSLEEAPALTPEAVEAEAFAPYFSSVDGAEAEPESSAAGLEAVSVAEPEVISEWQPEGGTAFEPEPEPEPAPAPEPEISSPPLPEEETAGA